MQQANLESKNNLALSEGQRKTSNAKQDSDFRSLATSSYSELSSDRQGDKSLDRDLNFNFNNSNHQRSESGRQVEKRGKEERLQSEDSNHFDLTAFQKQVSREFGFCDIPLRVYLV